MRWIFTLATMIPMVCAAHGWADEPAAEGEGVKVANGATLADLIAPLVARELAVAFEFADRDDDDDDDEDDDRGRRQRDRGAADRREREHRDGERSREGERRDSHPREPGPHGHAGMPPEPGYPGHFGGPAHPGGFVPGPGGPGPGGPGVHPAHQPGGPPHHEMPHTINIHVFLHHDFGGGPPAGMHGMMGRGRGEMRGPPRREHRDADEEDEDDEEVEEELESLRDEVASLRKEVAELTGIIRKLVGEPKQ